MTFIPLPFATLEWIAGGHPLERKKLVAGTAAALLEFAPGFADPNWCERGHVVHVLDGALEFELDDGVVRIEAGNGGVLDAGTRHRARNPGPGPVRLFIVNSEA